MAICDTLDRHVIAFGDAAALSDQERRATEGGGAGELSVGGGIDVEVEAVREAQRGRKARERPYQVATKEEAAVGTCDFFHQGVTASDPSSSQCSEHAAASNLLDHALELTSSLHHEEACSQALLYAAGSPQPHRTVSPVNPNAHAAAHLQAQADRGQQQTPMRQGDSMRGGRRGQRAAVLAASDREREAIVVAMQELSGRLRLEMGLLLRR